MKKIKALVLLAVVAVGIAAISTGAKQQNCCPDPDCCAHCPGSC
jgi:hypothetical protein